MKSIIVGLLLIFISFLSGCNGPSLYQTKVPAKVLSINTQILKGEMIGHFLGSSDGYISNDAIKVGVEIHILDNIVLVDLELSHAELTYYKNVNIIPVVVDYFSNSNRIHIRLHGRTVYYERLYL